MDSDNEPRQAPAGPSASGAGPSKAAPTHADDSIKVKRITSFFASSSGALAAIDKDAVAVRVGKRQVGRPRIEKLAAAPAEVRADSHDEHAGDEALAEVADAAEDADALERTAEKKKKGRQAANPLAPFRKYIVAMESRNGGAKMCKCEVCNAVMIDNMDTLKKHTGYSGDDREIHALANLSVKPITENNYSACASLNTPIETIMILCIS